jgi:hypothetical protein
MMASRSADACVVLDRVLEDAIDPYTRADALVQRLSALINLGRTAECTVAVDDAFDAAREIGNPTSSATCTRSALDGPGGHAVSQGRRRGAARRRWRRRTGSRPAPARLRCGVARGARTRVRIGRPEMLRAKGRRPRAAS